MTTAHRKKKTGRQRELVVIDLAKGADAAAMKEAVIQAVTALYQHFKADPRDPFDLIMRMAMDAGYVRFAANKGKPGRRARWATRDKARLWATVQILITQHRRYAAQWGAKTAIEYIEAGAREARTGWPYDGWPSSTGLLTRYNRILRMPEIKVFERFAVLPPDLWLIAMQHVAAAPGTDAESILRDYQARLATDEPVS